MDAVQDMPAQDSAEMREEIDSTRAAMADKLESLENRMIGTVQSAKDTVENSIQSAKDTVASVKQTFDIPHQVEQRPWTMVGGCFLAGLALGCLVPRGRRQSSNAPSAPSANGHAATPRLPAEPPSQLGVLEPFREEIDKVKGIAIGYVMGLVRDSIKESVPQMADNIDELMDGITTKLGGEPLAAHSSDARN
jgi:ElaB/YqjD/DUF883 family membrane-anchored ribosome-binding protein